MHAFSIVTLGIFIAGYTTARFDLLNQLHRLAKFAYETEVLVHAQPEVSQVPATLTSSTDKNP